MKLQHPLAWSVLIVLLIVGGWIRVAGLGAADLSHDELIHYFAAQSLARGEGPHLPSGESYARGIDLTRLSGLGARVAGDVELGMRLPSAIFGVLNLILFAAIAWAIGGPWAAVGATLLLAFHPEAIGRSRGVRFYTYQLNFGLVALFAVWQVVRSAGSARLPTLDERRRTWAWGAVAALAFLAAARVHVTTLSVLAGAGLAVLLAAAADVWRLGRQAPRTSAVVQLAIAGAVIALAVVIVEPGIVPALIAESQYQPLWARTSGGSPLAYYHMIWDAYPLLIALAPLLFVAAALKDLRLSIFLACWFGVPFLLHSLLFPWKGERFILLAMPALFLAAGIAMAMGGRALRDAIARRVSGPFGPAVAAAGVMVVALFVLASTPALRRGLRVPLGASENMVRRERWQHAATLLREMGADSVPIGSTTPLAALHYFGRADFAVRRDALERPVGTLTIAPVTKPGAANAALYPQGTPDYYAGVPVLTTPEAIRERFRERREVIVVIDSTRWMFGDIEPSLKRTLLEEAPEVCRGRCGALMAFRWTLQANGKDQGTMQ